MVLSYLEQHGKALQRMKYPLTEQWKSCPAIALSFDELEFVDLALHLPVGIDQC
jgi:hypothetical protein